MKDIIKEIYEDCDAYLRFLNDFENECAYTDSVVEHIIKKANELKIKYDKEIQL